MTLSDRPRFPGRPARMAFVFPGGGSLTASQVGMLWALNEAGLMPDLVIGSSAGALNAVAFASDPSPVGLEHLEAMWVALRRRHVAPLTLRTLITAATGRRDALVPDTGLRDLLDSFGVVRTLSETTVAAHVVATDLGSGQAVVLSEGESVPALLASCALPGLYQPVRVGPQLLVDGGVSADVPVLQAEALGATVTYVLPAADLDIQSLPRGPLPLAHHALRHLLASVARRDIAAAQGTVNILPAPHSRAGNPVDFRDTARLIDDGYRLATEWLADHMLPAGIPARPGVSRADLPTARFVDAS